MRSNTVLRPEAAARLDTIGRADVMVGIPSFNNARTIGHVVRAIGAGLVKYFPGLTAVIVNSDGGSRDGTPDIVQAMELDVGRGLLIASPERLPVRLVTGYQGIPGKGSAFRTMFEIAERLEARACAVVDADLRSITPEWVQLLLAPVLHEGFDYVCPLYSRHKYDGTITNSIVYPLVRSCFGRRVRQPIGGDFGFSGRLAAHYRSQEVWDGDVARYGIDIWMTTTALAGAFRVCQAYLGAKIHDAKDPGSDLTAMLVQVSGALFAQIEVHAKPCLAQEGSEHVPEFGFRYEVGLEPVPVNLRRMVDAFELGIKRVRLDIRRLPASGNPRRTRSAGGAEAGGVHHAAGPLGPHGVRLRRRGAPSAAAGGARAANPDPALPRAHRGLGGTVLSPTARSKWKRRLTPSVPGSRPASRTCGSAGTKGSDR